MFHIYKSYFNQSAAGTRFRYVILYKKKTLNNFIFNFTQRILN